MALTARRLGKAISENARMRISSLRAYPVIDTWMNPVTRGLARRFTHQEWLKSHDEIDFAFRMSDVEIGGHPCVRYETQTLRRNDTIILYLHGGGLVSGSPRVNASMILPTCQLAGVEAVGVAYTLVPEARFPAQLDEIEAVYLSLKEQCPEKSIVLFGDSIGGTLALSSMLRWRDSGIELPVGAILASPAVDGAGESDTHISIGGSDPLFSANSDRNCRRLFNFYAPGCDLTNPLISPIYGNLEGLPPILVHAGTREVLLGDAARLTEHARRAGVDVTLRVYDGMFHLFHMHWELSEAKDAHADIASFIETL
ncbi:alpha/beta hydrolase [Hyphococcus sp.]|uniref:alpha/beta hydrolase n=1 Tax=Hyphococcus sp. TaxID=2038636 RepID=UPI003CCC2643